MDTPAIHSCGLECSIDIVAVFELLWPAASKSSLVRPTVSTRLDSTELNQGLQRPGSSSKDQAYKNTKADCNLNFSEINDFFKSQR